MGLGAQGVDETKLASPFGSVWEEIRPGLRRVGMSIEDWTLALAALIVRLHR